MGEDTFVVFNERLDLIVLLHLIVDFCRSGGLFSCEEFYELPELLSIILNDAPWEIGYLSRQNVIVEPFSCIICTLKQNISFNGIVTEDILRRS